MRKPRQSKKRKKRVKNPGLVFTDRKERNTLIWRDRKLNPNEFNVPDPSLKLREIEAQAKFSAVEARRVNLAANALSRNHKRPVLVICNARTGSIYKPAIEGISAQVIGKKKRKWAVEELKKQHEWTKANEEARTGRVSRDVVRQLREAAALKVAGKALKEGKIDSFVFAVDDYKMASVGEPGLREYFTNWFTDPRAVRRRFSSIMKRANPIVLFVDAASYREVPKSFERFKKAFGRAKTLEVPRAEKAPIKRISQQAFGNETALVLFDPTKRGRGTKGRVKHKPGWQSNFPQVFHEKQLRFAHKRSAADSTHFNTKFKTTRGKMTIRKFVKAHISEGSGKKIAKRARPKKST